MTAAVRVASLADRDAIVHLDAACFADAWTADSVAHELSIGHGRAWIAEADGAAVGYLLGWLIDDEAQINRVGTLPDRRRGGIGVALVEAALAGFARDGGATALLEVHASNAAALALYARFGFAQVGRRAAYYADGGAALVLRASLPAQRRGSGRDLPPPAR